MSLYLHKPNETCISFNLSKCARHAKNNGMINQSWVAKSIDPQDKNKVEKCLVVRMFYDASPWLVVHENLKEIVKSPICVPIVERLLHENEVKIYLRDFAGRGNDACIKRLFTFFFRTNEEAQSFQFSFNAFFHKWYNAQRAGTARAARTIASPKLSFYHASMDKDESPEYLERLRNEMGFENCKFDPTCIKQKRDDPLSPCKKKLRFTSKCSETHKNKRSGDNTNDKEDEQIFQHCLVEYKIGDEASAFDDCFSQTQEF